MGYALKLRPAEHLALPRAHVRALLRAGDGNAALLYLLLSSSGAAEEDAAICRTLHWDRATLTAAEEVLEKAGLLGEKQEVAQELQPPPMPERAEYSRADITMMLEKDRSFTALRDAVGHKLNKLMTEKDDAMLLGLYDYLGLPPEVIFLLVGHCIQRTERRYGPERRPTMRQVEKEGYRWKRLGLMTQELAEEYLKDYARRQSIIPQMMDALHLGGRDPVRGEAEFLERWIGWGFSAEAVELAYEKTVFKCGKMEWKYCNGILRDWDKKGLHTVEEITARDAAPSAGRAAPRREGSAGAAEDVQDSVAWMKAYLKQTEGQEG